MERGSKFKNGSIKRMRLTNFMCVDQTLYSFNPGINFIIGANGTGKSTIVCAIYLIFNGDCKKLGRGKALNMVSHIMNIRRQQTNLPIKYINNKHPIDYASIEVLLEDDRGDKGEVRVRYF